MNRNWFSCTVKYQKADADGEESKHTDLFLLDAMTYTETEARMNHIISQMGGGTFTIDKITKTSYKEVINIDESDKWFRVKVSLVAFDDETEKEKQTHQFILVAGKDIEDVYTKTKMIMQDTMSGYVIPSISYTKIVDVFPYLEEERVDREMKEKGFTPISEVQSESEE